MMLVDVGNTSVKWAFRTAGGLTGHGRLALREHAPESLAERAWAGMESPGTMAVANVAGRTVQEAISRWTAHHWGLLPLFVEVTASAAGVTNAYAEPGRLGVDRWAAMVAAWHAQRGPVLVIDCGSAITIDFVDAGGRHHGGLIAPGVNTMRHCLSLATANIDISGEQPVSRVSLLAVDTQGAIRSGTIRMATTLIDGVRADVGERFGDGIHSVICGGDAPSILPLLKHAAIHDPDLVLKGVSILAGEPA